MIQEDGDRKRVSPETLGDIIGAQKTIFVQRIAFYIPNKNRINKALNRKKINEWKQKALLLLGEISEGATSVPPADAIWFEVGQPPQFEKTVVIYSFIDPDRFLARRLHVREFLHDFGRDADQSAVFVEFDNFAYKIREYYPERPAVRKPA